MASPEGAATRRQIFTLGWKNLDELTMEALFGIVYFSPALPVIAGGGICS